MAKHKPSRKPIHNDADRAHVLTLHSQGMGRNAISRETGYSVHFVSTTVQAAGKSFARTGEVIAATKAKQIDNKARRADIVARMYKQAEDVLARLESPTEYKTITKETGGRESTEVLDFIPPTDRRNELTSVGIALDKAINLEKIDADQGTDRAESMLDKLGTDLREAAKNALGNVGKTDPDDSDV